jgi:hypothetical protein
MDLSGLGIDVKLKEKKRRCGFFNPHQGEMGGFATSQEINKMEVHI